MVRRTLAKPPAATHHQLRWFHALDALLMEDGYAAFGVNALARSAGADKSLLYRHFGTLEDFLSTYARERSLWPQADEFCGGAEGRALLPDLPVWKRFTLLGEHGIRALREHPVALEIFAWSLSAEENAVTRAQEKLRSKTLRDLSREFGGTEAAALHSLIWSGLCLVALQERRRGRLRAKDWKRLEETAAKAYRRVLKKKS